MERIYTTVEIVFTFIHGRFNYYVSFQRMLFQLHFFRSERFHMFFFPLEAGHL